MDIDNGLNVRDCYKSLSNDELCEISQNDRLNFSFLFLNLEKNLNISNLVRSAHLLGAKNVFIIGSTRYDKRGTVGAQHYTNIKRIACEFTNQIIIDCIANICRENDMLPVFLEQHDNAVDLSSSEFSDLVQNNHVCVIVGNEGDGIDKEIIDGCGSNVVEISQLGVIRSFNAAVAGSLVMYKIKEILG